MAESLLDIGMHYVHLRHRYLGIRLSCLLGMLCGFICLYIHMYVATIR